MVAEAVDVAVEHAEGGGDEDGVVNLDVGRSGVAGFGDGFGGDVFAAALDLAGDVEESLQLVGDVSVVEVVS